MVQGVCQGLLKHHWVQFRQRRTKVQEAPPEGIANIDAGGTAERVEQLLVRDQQRADVAHACAAVRQVMHATQDDTLVPERGVRNAACRLTSDMFPFLPNVINKHVQSK